MKVTRGIIAVIHADIIDKILNHGVAFCFDCVDGMPASARSLTDLLGSSDVAMN